MKKQQQTISIPTIPQWQKYVPLLLCGLVFLLYANTLNHSYNMDDELVTRKHKLTSKGISAIPEIFTSPYYSDAMGYAYEYRPIVLTSFAIEHEFFGDKPAVSHFFNVLLYVVTIFILFKLLRKLFYKYSYWLSVLAVLLFVLHPLHTEVVASIKNRDEILALLGALGAWWFAVKYAETGKWHHLIWVSLLFLAGILSKLSILSCVVLIPLSIVFFSSTSNNKVIIISLCLGIPVFLFLYLSGKLYTSFSLIYFIALSVPWLLHYFIFSSQNQLGLNVDGLLRQIKININSTFVSTDDSLATFRLRPLNIASTEIWQTSFIIGFAILLCFGLGCVILPTLYMFVAWFFLFGILFFLVNANQRNLLILVFVPMYLQMCLIVGHKTYLDLGLCFLLLLYLQYPQNRNIALVLCIASFFPLYIYFNRPFDYFLGLILPFLITLIKDRNKILKFLYYGVCIILIIAIISNIVLVFTEDNLGSGIFEILVGCIILLSIIKESRKYLVPALLLVFIPFMLYLRGLDKPIVPNITPSQNSTTSVTNQSDGDAFLGFTSQNRPILFAELPVTTATPLEERIGSAFDVLGFYLRKVIIPYPQGYYYGYAFFEPVSIFGIGPIMSLLIHTILLVLSLIYIRRYPFISFGILFYLGSIILFSGFMYPVVGVAGDRFTYVATLGFSLSLAWLILRVTMGANSLFENIRPNRSTMVMAAFMLIVFGFITINRNGKWENALVLMENDIEYLDESAQAHNLYALNLMRESFENNKLKPDRQFEMRKLAVQHFDRAIQIWPDFFNAAYDKGRSAAIIGDYKLAIEGYEKAVLIGPEEGFIEPYIQLSQLYLQTGRYVDFLKNGMILLKKSESPEAYNTVARGFYLNGQNDSAKVYLRKGILKYPQETSLKRNMAEIFKSENVQDSVDYYMQ